jgi:hypothetical protein
MGKSRIGEHSKKELDIKEGDMVVISKQFLNSFESHCEDENDIPEHNHGTVTKVIKPRDKDEKGRMLHPSPYTRMGMYDYVTFKMPNDKEISLFSVDLRKLY